jgi:hypothetical protein
MSADDEETPMMFPAMIRHTDDEPAYRMLTPSKPLLEKPPREERGGILVDERDGEADVRAANLARKNGGPGIVPGGVHKNRAKIIEVRRELALESECLRHFYEATHGDDWTEHNSWQKLLVQLRQPDGKPRDIDMLANASAAELEHFRDELYGLRAKWVDKKTLPPTLTRVIEIKMPSNNLVGVLPDCLSELVYLRTLQFPENKLQGPIPAYLGNHLLELRHIDLSYNMLTGDLPTFGVRFISSLKTIRLHDNSIGGRLSVLSGNLTELTALTVHNNKIGGVLPESVTNMKKLEEFTFHNNKLRGPIPEVTFVSSFTSFLLCLNAHLSPSCLTIQAFGRIMPKLRVISLSRNRLTGSIPVDSLACCAYLRMLCLDGNRFDFSVDSLDQVLDYLKGRLGKTAMISL